MGGKDKAEQADGKRKMLCICKMKYCYFHPMKKGIFFIVLMAGAAFLSTAQTEPDPPYRRFPTVPPLQLLLTDSATIFTDKELKKNQPVFVILFSPDCEHCQKETEELIDHIEEFKKIQIVMATTLPVYKMKEFYEKNQLSRFKNITVGQDKFFLLPTFFRISNLPFLAFYDKKGKLIDVFEGALPVKKVLEKFQ